MTPQQIIKRNAGGASLMQLAQELGISVWALKRRVRAEVPDWRPRTGRPRGPADPNRDKEIRRMRAEGLSLAEIGDRFGLTKQRISQIVGEA